MKPAEIKRYMKDSLNPRFEINERGDIYWAGQKIDPSSLTVETRARFGFLIPFEMVVRQKAKV